MKSLKKTTSLNKLLAALAISAASVSAQAVTYNYAGVIESCTGVCGIFTAVGQSADFAFDSTAAGPGSIATGDISNVDIALSTPSGGALSFTNGVALASSLSIDTLDNITGGAVTLEGTGSTTGIVARSELDFATGSWTAWVVATDGSLTEIAGGSGSFAPITAVPVPAAAWLFGSALVGLVGVRRRPNA